MITYKAIKKKGEKIIEKHGEVHEFTLSSVHEHLTKLEQKHTELKAQAELSGAEMTNIETYHPFIKKMSEKDIHTARMYYESSAMKKACELKMKEIKVVVKEYKQAIKDIKDQTGEAIETTETTETK